MNRFDDTGCFCIETLCSLCLCGEKSWPEDAELLASIADIVTPFVIALHEKALP